MNPQYVVSIKSEVLAEAYSDVLARLLRFMDRKGINLEDTTNVWVRMFFELRDAKDTLLDVRSMEDAGVLEGKYLLAKRLLDGEENE